MQGLGFRVQGLGFRADFEHRMVLMAARARTPMAKAAASCLPVPAGVHCELARKERTPTKNNGRPDAPAAMTGTFNIEVALRRDKRRYGAHLRALNMASWLGLG